MSRNVAWRHFIVKLRTVVTESDKLSPIKSDYPFLTCSREVVSPLSQKKYDYQTFIGWGLKRGFLATKLNYHLVARSSSKWKIQIKTQIFHNTLVLSNFGWKYTYSETWSCQIMLWMPQKFRALDCFLSQSLKHQKYPVICKDFSICI